MGTLQGQPHSTAMPGPLDALALGHLPLWRSPMPGGGLSCLCDCLNQAPSAKLQPKSSFNSVGMLVEITNHL